ncbi:hypothetical protein TRAPUB_9293 [Trametes pubescens]|uniref:Uncharacterized protein n=1 Tax=Trametes pubescens TaxID=154538 RepID=A0A1M2W342_TRAPU|nr:hypothetical protein TRAPUB_9293 [Trametes pubescens]
MSSAAVLSLKREEHYASTPRSAMREHEQGSTLGIAVHTGTRSRSQRVALTTNIVLESQGNSLDTRKSTQTEVATIV